MRRNTIDIITLGCSKNLVDSEMMLGQLAESGYLFTDDETQADIVVINTCCFIKDAKEESIETILEMAQLRKKGDIKALIVTGCLAQRYKEEIQKEIPEVDEILGISDIDHIVQAIEETLSNETLLKLNMLLNTTLTGMAIEEINLGMIARLKEQAGDHGEVVGDVLDAIANTIQVEGDMEIYTSGATNVFKYPELSDSQSAQEIINAFEEKQLLQEIVTETLSREENRGIQVYIGNEAPVQSMKDCSVVTATYELGEGMQGTIGIIGPKRMDYENVMKTLKTLMTELDEIFHREK